MDSSSIEVVVVIFFLAIWFFSAYVFFRVGKKLQVKKSYLWYLVPIYNNWLLMKPIGLSPWLLIGFFAPYLNLVIYAYIWAQTAKALGKNPWLYGLTIVFFGLPIIILAFDKSIWVEFRSNTSILELFPEDITLPNLQVEEFETIRVGRDESNEVVIDNQYLSSKHIDIYAHSGNLFVTDLGTNDEGSTNGTYINGMKLTPSHPTRLNQGERLILGSEDVVYFLQ